MLKLLGRSNSINVRKLLWTCAEPDLAPEHEESAGDDLLPAAPALRIVDDRLAETGAYIAGPTFTLADIVLGLATCRWTMTPIERPALPAVAAWTARLARHAPHRAHCANGRR